jgi:hypothetical protein
VHRLRAPGGARSQSDQKRQHDEYLRHFAREITPGRGGGRWLCHAGMSITVGRPPSRCLAATSKLLRLADVDAIHNPSRDCRNPPLTARHA